MSFFQHTQLPLNARQFCIHTLPVVALYLHVEFCLQHVNVAGKDARLAIFASLKGFHYLPPQGESINNPTLQASDHTYLFFMVLELRAVHTLVFGLS